MSDGNDRRALGSVDPGDLLEGLFRDGRTNAVLAWLVVAVLAAAFLDSVVDFDLQWLLFVAATSAVVLLPPVAYRDWRVTLPWELLVLATLPVIVRAVFGGEIGTFATYFSLAGLALVVVVELHTFTRLQVTHWFAVALVVLTTMASVAAWSILRWNLDRHFGTAYLSTNDALMAEFLWVTLAGFAAGVLFDAYFRRRDSHLRAVVRRVIRR